MTEALRSVDLASSHAFRNLTMFPLIAKGERTADYLTLDEALATGAVRITETSESGTVPELSLRNDGNTRVLLLDGEELLGAKQNRVLNLTILVPAVSDVRISRVVCRVPRAPPVLHRAAHAVSAEEGCREYADRRRLDARLPRTGPGGNAIAMKKAARLDSESDTGAMSAVFDRHEASVAAPPPPPPLTTDSS